MGEVKKYRLKPVTREAIKLDWATWNEVCEFVDKKFFGEGVYLDDKGKVLPKGKTSNKLGLYLIASHGDYIVKGNDGEFWAVKPDIFNKTYEEIE